MSDHSMRSLSSPRSALPLQQFSLGGGLIEATPHGWDLVLPPISHDDYGDAQLHDYAGIPRARYPWRPPLMLSLKARLSSQLQGTAGFGFWNNPLGKVPALPQATWFFFASPPSAMELADGVPGSGWKAATIDAGRKAALVWAPLAPLVMLACRRLSWRRRLWPYVQRALAIAETPVTIDRTAWHDYQIFWLRDRVLFGIDGHLILTCPAAPRGPLGLVIWVDNQWARVMPSGSLGWGLLDVTKPQSLFCRDIKIIDARWQTYSF